VSVTRFHPSEAYSSLRTWQRGNAACESEPHFTPRLGVSGFCGSPFDFQAELSAIVAASFYTDDYELQEKTPILQPIDSEYPTARHTQSVRKDSDKATRPR